MSEATNTFVKIVKIWDTRRPTRYYKGGRAFYEHLDGNLERSEEGHEVLGELLPRGDLKKGDIVLLEVDPDGTETVCSKLPADDQPFIPGY